MGWHVQINQNCRTRAPIRVNKVNGQWILNSFLQLLLSNSHILQSIMLKIADINENIIFAILTKRDVVTIQIFEQVRAQATINLINKYLIDKHQMCNLVKHLDMSRRIWISLALDHDYDCAPSLLPHEYIQSLTTERLRDLAIRSARGYMNWNSSNGPKTTRSIRMRIPELHTDSFNLPGSGLHSCVKIANEFVVTWSAGIFTVGN